MSINKIKVLGEIGEQVLNLTESPLYKYRTENSFLPVIGEGNTDAEIMFVGEAPGKNEALSGKPFCGKAGDLLDSLLDSINTPRESVYITNIVKDRPQENRDPSIEEIAVYGPFLDKQINIIQPKVIVTLGRYSMNYIMDRFGLKNKIETISEAHGKVYDAKTSYGNIVIIPEYHPAATIYNRKLIPILEKDFKVIREVVHSNH